MLYCDSTALSCRQVYTDSSPSSALNSSTGCLLQPTTQYVDTLFRIKHTKSGFATGAYQFSAVYGQTISRQALHFNFVASPAGYSV